MAKRKCKPVVQWTQLPLFPASELELKRLSLIRAIRELPHFKSWTPREDREAAIAVR